MTDVIKKYYDTYMPSLIVPRLSPSNFSSCGSLVDPKFKTVTTVVFFYTQECRFCQETAFQVSKFDSQYADKIGAITAAIDLSVVENSSLIKASKNFSYKLGDIWPTIIIFYQGKPCSFYSGPRNAEALNDYIVKNIGIGKSCEFKFVPCD